MALTYLYLLEEIRQLNEDDVEIGNLFVLNFVRVYKTYLKLKRKNSQSIGKVFYLHFIFLAIVIFDDLVKSRIRNAQKIGPGTFE